MFCGGFIESAEKEIEITTIDDIQPEAFRVFLQWLYGQSFEEAKEFVLRKKNDFTTDLECYETYYLNFLICLLKVTDTYGVEQLKNIIEYSIIEYCANTMNEDERLEESEMLKMLDSLMSDNE